MFGCFSAQLKTTGCYEQLIIESRKLHSELTEVVAKYGCLWGVGWRPYYERRGSILGEKKCFIVDI